MGKLHQVLAVEDSLRQKSNSILQETKKTFSSKGDHFDGLQKIYIAFEEDGTKIAPEVKELVTTIRDKIDFTVQAVIESMDTKASISETNASGITKAEVKVGNAIIGSFSAITLLELEKALVDLRGVYGEIPTLDPTKKWEVNDKNVPHTYITEPYLSFRSEKTRKALIAAPATDKHPAQVSIYDDEKQVGKYETTYLSGKITPTQKSELLANIDSLISAVKDARARANNVNVLTPSVGKEIFAFIHGDII